MSLFVVAEAILVRLATTENRRYRFSMMSRCIIIIVAVSWISGVAFAGEEPKPRQPMSASAVAAMKDYAKAAEDAEKACQQAKLAANKRLIEKLG